MKFDDKCIYHTIPNLIKRLIRKDKPSAKDYLKNCLQSQDDLELLYYFDQYTLEAIILNVLSMVFHSLKVDSAVRVATLLDQLDSAVRVQAALLKSRKLSNKTTNPSNEEQQKEEKTEERKTDRPIFPVWKQEQEKNEALHRCLPVRMWYCFTRSQSQQDLENLAPI